MEEEGNRPQTQQSTEQTPSLFAAFAAAELVSVNSTPNNSAGQWLQNSSFTTNISVINEAVSKYPLQQDDNDDDNEQQVTNTADETRKRYEFLSSDEEDRRASKKHKRRKKIREDSSSRSSFAYDAYSRKPGIDKWASQSTSATDKDYYFDSRGDRDNLAFGSIYRMDVARYKLCNSKKLSEHAYYRQNKNSDGLEWDGYIDTLDAKLRSGVDIGLLSMCGFLLLVDILVEDYIPLSDETSDNPSGVVLEESWEDEVLRKIKEFNKMTRV